MHFKLMPGQHLYLVRSPQTREAKFFVEAKDEVHALERAVFAAQYTATAKDKPLIVEKPDGTLPLPHFMEGYFATMQKDSSRGH